MASKSGLWRSRARADGPKSRPGGTPRGAPRCLSENLGHPRRPRGVGLSPPVRWGRNRGRLYHRLRHQRACSFFLGRSHPGIRRCLELLITNIDGGECLSSFGDLDPSFKFSLDNTWLPTSPLVLLKNWSTLVPPASSETLELSSPGPHLVPFCGLLLTKQKPTATCYHGDLKR